MADEVQIARAVFDEALATNGVHSLATGGPFAEIATYGPGETVQGVVVRDDEVEVHIVADYPPAAPLPQLAENIREKVDPIVEGRKTTVVVADVAEDEETADESL